MSSTPYKWFRIHVRLTCDQCGNGIAMQQPEIMPQCDECGHQPQHSWPDVMQFTNISLLKSESSGTVKMMGLMEASMVYEHIPALACPSCQAEMTVSAEQPSGEVECGQCHKKITLVQCQGLDEFIFTSAGVANASGETAPAMIAVRCASCGAPLEADPSKPGYDCSFCGTHNILPPALRFKRQLNPIFAGVN